jgi:hypothetical protein
MRQVNIRVLQRFQVVNRVLKMIRKLTENRDKVNTITDDDPAEMGWNNKLTGY